MIEVFEKIKKVSASIAKIEKNIEKCKESAPGFDATPSRLRRHNDRINGLCEEKKRLIYSLHVACVDAGVADYRGNGYYEDGISIRDGAFSQSHYDEKEKPSIYQEMLK